MRNDFAVFIITHGRPNNQKTLKMLQENGYTGQYYLVLDDQDKTIQQYLDNYGPEHIIVFNKNLFIRNQDTGFQKPVAKFAVYARNAVETIAKMLDYKYFMVWDDDIYNIRMRYDENGSLKSSKITGLIDTIFEKCIQYVENTNIACLTFGVVNIYRNGVAAVNKWSDAFRLGVNCFLRNTNYHVQWRLNMCEDLITPLEDSVRGNVWLTFTPIQIDVSDFAGKVEGGNTDTYRTFDEFKINFLPVMVHPSCTEVCFFKDHFKTVTHGSVALNKIISGDFKRGD